MSVRSGRRGPASARGPNHRGAHDHELKPRAGARPLDADVSLPGMEEQRWGQHNARPALPSRSQRANAGPGPLRHSTTLTMDAPPPAGPTLSFFACATNPACFFLAVERSPQGQRASIEAKAAGRMSRHARLQAAPAITFVTRSRPGPTRPGPNALPRFRPELALLPGG